MTPAVLVETFPCTSCQKAYPIDYQHPSGFCEGCLEKGRRYMLNALGWDGVVEVAHMIWDDIVPAPEMPEWLAA